jgi:hypothetical protein
MNCMRILTALVFSLATAALVAGCKSTPKIDWNTRVGTYTYNEAVADMGPPDKSAELSDGTLVAEWITGRRSSSGFSIGTGVYGGHGGVSVGQTVGGGGGNKVLRLVFDQEKRLKTWAAN